MITQRFLATRDSASALEDLERYLEECQGEIAEIRERAALRDTGQRRRAFDSGEGRSSLRGDIES